MGKVHVTDVEVGTTETEIIGSTQVDADKDKLFTVNNGDKDIEVKAYASSDGMEWTLKKTKQISPNSVGSLQVDHNLNIYVKLTGVCLDPGASSTVDAQLEW